MALLQRESTRQAHEDAREAVKLFWSSTNIIGGDLERAEACIREAQLSVPDLHSLRATLPISNPGTTGQRAKQIDRILKNLAKEAGH